MSLWYGVARPWTGQLLVKLYRDKPGCEDNPACDYHTITDRRWMMSVPNHYEFKQPDSVARQHWLYNKWYEPLGEETRFDVYDLDV